MTDDLTTRLAALETRVALLEKAALQRLDIPAPWPVHPVAPPTTPPATGCMCPVGAEISCGNWSCPRRAPSAVRSVSDTLTTTSIGAIPRNGSGICTTCPPDWCGAGSESFCPEREGGEATGARVRSGAGE